MRDVHGGAAVEAGQGAGGAEKRQLGAQTVRAEVHAEARRRFEHGIWHGQRGQQRACCQDALLQALVRLAPGLDERGGVALERVTPADDVDAGADVGGRADLDREAEAVEQLRTQLALLGVAAADQDEAGRVAHAQTLALDDVLARRCDIDEEIDQVILEEVHLVDIEEAAVGAGEQARLEGAFAACERALQVEGADDAVLGGAQRHVDDGAPARCA